MIKANYSSLCSSSSSTKKGALSMLLLTYVLLLLWRAASNPFPINTPLTRTQMEDLFRAYAPYLYLHPDEEYLPSSVDWFFSNGALLYKKGEESRPVRIEPGGTNLPKGGDPAGLYWLDLPADKGGRDRVSQGHIASAEAYVHFKPGVENGMFTDIQVWMFYPFNGHTSAKIWFIKRVSLGRAGEHVSDWEHVTLRVRNVDGVLDKVYFSQHGGGKWVDASLLQFESGNRFAWYSSRNGHAGNNETGLYLQGPGYGFGIRNDWARSNKVVDTGARFVVVASEGEAEAVAEPPWLSYESKWGPTKKYGTIVEVRRVRKFLLGKLKKLLDKLVKVIDEVYGTNGPAGPKVKNNWNGNEA
ncbi:hypothetical protein SASPL_143617 [Salvia splendens]|uniref:Vacuolar protein sorting-associated protein 62 n=1 Tax=Salvia splendens TaxID=180675 RepID=A0A8X8WMD8_SALSN|nr:vacuolar protein sorting-associated protein 62-like [Salvia splendens]KAG6397450.1 hypothetical protein SASPL_143617 [Salvia splendens]